MDGTDTGLKSGVEISLNRAELGNAVRAQRLSEELSLRELAKQVGVSYPTLCRIERGEIKSPEVEHLLALCRWLRRPPESFFDGIPASLRVRKHYSTTVNAGLPAPTEGNIEYSDLCEDLMPDQDAYFTVRAKGDSMIEARIYDDDLLVVKASETAHPGEIVIAVINDEYCVKRFETKGGSLILRSANPKYADIIVKEGDEFRIRGIVTHAIHRYQKAG